MAAEGQDTGKGEHAYVAAWLEEAICGSVGSLPEKSHKKLTGHFLIEWFFRSFSTGQYAEEGHRSAHSGEKGAAAGASEERRYGKSTDLWKILAF